MPEGPTPGSAAARPPFGSRRVVGPGRTVGPGRLVHAAAFGEPSVVPAGDRWWAVAGTAPGGALPTLSSVDLVHWERMPTALPAPGSWAVPRSVRSPELVELGPGRWLLLYTAVAAVDGMPAIGVATAAGPGAVFVDALPGPLVGGSGGSGPGPAGATDPAVFTTTYGTRWLYWADGERPAGPRSVRAVRLAEDALSLLGGERAANGSPPIRPVLEPTLAWQAGVVAAPQVVVSASGLLMFYEAGTPDTAGRCIAVARSDSPAGPFVADPEPLLVSADAYDGPGHPAVVADPDGQHRLLFAAWGPGRAGTPGAQQRLWLASLDLDDVAPGFGRVRVTDPIPPPVPLPAPVGHWRLPVPDDPTADQERVLRSFTMHAAIRAVPARHHLRVVLLDLLAQLFEPGVRYPESEVDRRLTGIWAPGVHPDYARLRRLLVDENFLDRTGGLYRRSGGTVSR